MKFRVTFAEDKRVSNYTSSEVITADDYSVGYAGDLTFCRLLPDTTLGLMPVKTYAANTWETVTFIPDEPEETEPA